MSSFSIRRKSYTEIMEDSLRSQEGSQPSANPCPECGKTMSVADEEAAGICGSCYWTAAEDYNS